MKKLVLILVLSSAGIFNASEVEAKTTNAPTTIGEKSTTTLSLRKRRRNRQRKGFMWGLFKKKSPCGCPNH